LQMYGFKFYLSK